MPASLVGSRRLEWLRSQRDAAVAEITTITERAADEDRDLTDAEQASCQRRREAVETHDRDIAVEVQALERQAEYEERCARVAPALTRSRDITLTIPQRSEPDTVYRSVGEYLSDVLATRHGTDSQAATRVERYRSSLQRANQVLDDNRGIVPEPIVMPVLGQLDQRRPAIDAATKRPMPAGGETFTRPVITQHTLVGVQSAEKTDLASRPLQVGKLTVTKETFGGYVNLSFQNREWSQPSILDLLVSDLAAAYADETDAAFCTALTAGVTQTVSAATGATPATTSESWLAGIYQAAALVFAARNAQPNTLWVSPDVWAQLGSLVDGSGRPMFPAVAPANALGNLGPGLQDGNVAGFKLAVDANFAAGTAILGDSGAVEFFEQQGGLVQAVEPSILGQAVAFYGFAASVVVRPEALVKITSV